MWYPLTNEQVETHFPELRLQVLEAREKSRSKYKHFDDDEYEWGIDFVVSVSTPPACSFFDVITGNIPVVSDPGTLYAGLTQRWKFRRNTQWSVSVPGPEGGFKNPDALDKLLGQYGIK